MTDDWAQSLMNRIAAARIAAGLTQSQLAERVGVSRPQITNIECGNTDPSLSTLRRIAEALGTRVGVLLNEDEVAYRAGREEAAREIAEAIDEAAKLIRIDLPGNPPSSQTELARSIRMIAYERAASIARELRVPDCGYEYHGADGGACSWCGFDAAEPWPAGVRSEEQG